MRAEVLADEPFCWVPGCGAPSTTVDHLIPVAAGGTHQRSNLRGCCEHHNLARGSRPLDPRGVGQITGSGRGTRCDGGLAARETAGDAACHAPARRG